MGATCDMRRDLPEVFLHRFGLDEWHGEARCDAARRADRAKQIGAFVALVGGLGWPCSPLRPLPDKSVLLADPGLVLEPDLDALAPCYGPEMRRERAGEVYGMARPLPSAHDCVVDADGAEVGR